MAKKPETIFKEKVLRDLRSLDRTWCVKIQQVSIRGTPDVIACVNGRFVALELKKDAKAREDKLQRYTLLQIALAKGYSVVVHPDSWQEAYGHLKKMSQDSRYLM